jgi:uncharacterized protein (TIGR02594 family)
MAKRKTEREPKRDTKTAGPAKPARAMRAKAGLKTTAARGNDAARRRARAKARRAAVVPAHPPQPLSSRGAPNFGPVRADNAAFHRAALTGGIIAVVATLISIGWLTLFDRATAVPNRTPQRADIVSPVSTMNDPLPAVALPDYPSPISLLPQRPAAKKSSAGATQRPRHLSRPMRRHRSEASAGTNAFASAGGTDVGGSNSLIAEARRYMGTNPTGRASLWCGAFMDLVLRKTGHPGGGNLALGYAHYGTRVSGPEIGAIAVMGRRGGGHVGVVSGIDPNGNPIVISGNHNRTVAEAVYPRQRVITYVMPN